MPEVPRLLGDEGRPVRVAHLTTVDTSLLHLLATELEVDVAAGCDTWGISSPGPDVAYVEALGVRHAAVPSFGRSWDPVQDVRSAGELRRTLRAVRPDVLHTHTPKAGVLGRVLGRLLHVPVVVDTCHGLWTRPDQRSWVRGAVVSVEAVASWFGHAELYQNAEDLSTMRPFLPRAHGRLVGNGVDLSRFPGSGRHRVRAELGVGPDELLVGGVGRLVQEKGVLEYVAAAGRLSGRARFVWVGPDDSAKADAVDPPDDGPVVFLGARRDMPDVYAALDVFVLPSWREGFSRSGMEAAASGLPMVLTDIRGCREIGEDGRHLLLVPPRSPEALQDALLRVLTDNGLRSRLGQAARDRAASSFDQREVALQSLRTYVDVARRRGRHWRLEPPS